MTNIYIKSFNRAMYLDRSIRSVKSHAKGYGDIIVLDDGTEERFLEKIARDHGDVTIRRSPGGAEKRRYLRSHYTEKNNLRHELTEMGLDPIGFWVKEIAKDENPYVVVLEEDTWLKGALDLGPVVKNVAANNTAILKLWLGGETGEAKGDAVDIRVPFDDGFILNYFTPVIKEIFDVYKIFILCGAVYKKEYWLNSFQGAAHYLDEIFMLNRALEYVLKRQSENTKVTFARSEKETVHQSHASTCRTDSGGTGVEMKIDNALYNKAADEAWLAGTMDSMNGFPGEISDDYLVSIFEQSLSAPDIEKWRDWRKSYDAMFKRVVAKL